MDSPLANLLKGLFSWYLKGRLAPDHIPYHVLVAQNARQGLFHWTGAVVEDVTCLIRVVQMMPLIARTQNQAIFAWATLNMVMMVQFINDGIVSSCISSGYLCPTSHPYTCATGSKCTKALWKPESSDLALDSSAADCDGGRLLDKTSVCCPTEVISCNNDDRFKCWSNPSFQGWNWSIITDLLNNLELTYSTLTNI